MYTLLYISSHQNELLDHCSIESVNKLFNTSWDWIEDHGEVQNNEITGKAEGINAFA